MMQSLRDVNRKNNIYIDDSELLLKDKTIFRFLYEQSTDYMILHMNKFESSTDKIFVYRVSIRLNHCHLNKKYCSRKNSFIKKNQHIVCKMSFMYSFISILCANILRKFL